MTAVKYKTCKNSHKTGSKLGGFLFENPLVYLIFLLIISFLILFLCPHTVIFNQSKDDSAEGFSDISDFNVNIPSVSQLFQNSISEPLKLAKEGPLPALCSILKDSEKFDCFPRGNVSEAACNLRGCCWVPVNSSKQGIGVPYCYYPSKFKSYKYVNVSQTDTAITAYLENVVNSSYPNNIQLLKIDIKFLHENILQVKVGFNIKLAVLFFFQFETLTSLFTVQGMLRRI